MRAALVSIALAGGLAATAGSAVAALAYDPVLGFDGAGSTANSNFARDLFLTRVTVSGIITGAGQVSTDTASGMRPISGSRFWSAAGGSQFTVTFSTPVTAFGFFMTDAGDWGGQLLLEIERATSGTAPFLVPNTLSNAAPPNCGAAFVGLIATEPANASERLPAGACDAHVARVRSARSRSVQRRSTDGAGTGRHGRRCSPCTARWASSAA